MLIRADRNPYHCCHAPDIGAGAPFGTKYDFRGSVLAGLDIIREVVTYPARVT